MAAELVNAFEIWVGGSGIWVSFGDGWDEGCEHENDSDDNKGDAV